MRSEGLPKGWTWAKVREICDLINGRAFKPGEWSSNGVPIVRIQNLNDLRANFNHCNFEVEEKYLIDKGQLLFAWSGTPRTSFGAHLWNRGRAVLNQHIFKVEISEDCISKRFLMHALNQNIAEYIRKAHGTAGLAHITKGKFEESLIPLPPLAEQHHIVSKVEELLTKLDAGVKALNVVKAQLKRFRQAVLRQAYEGELTPTDVKNWEWVKTGEIMDTINNGYTPKSNRMNTGRGDVPFIKVYNLTFDGKLDFTKNPTFIDRRTHSEDLKRSVTYPNDVLINIVGPPLGKVSIVPDTYPEWNINQAIVLFRPNEKIIPEFLSYFLQNPSTIHWLTRTSRATAGQHNVKVSTCREIPIPQIPIKEQRRIVSEVDRRFSVTDEVEKVVKESFKHSERLRQSILKKAFEGKLVPQDPTDEPAETLLGRIKEEKARQEAAEERARKGKRKTDVKQKRLM